MQARVRGSRSDRPPEPPGSPPPLKKNRRRAALDESGRPAAREGASSKSTVKIPQDQDSSSSDRESDGEDDNGELPAYLLSDDIADVAGKNPLERNRL